MDLLRTHCDALKRKLRARPRGSHWLNACRPTRHTQAWEVASLPIHKHGLVTGWRKHPALCNQKPPPGNTKQVKASALQGSYHLATYTTPANYGFNSTNGSAAVLPICAWTTHACRIIITISDMLFDSRSANAKTQTANQLALSIMTNNLCGS